MTVGMLLYALLSLTLSVLLPFGPNAIHAVHLAQYDPLGRKR